MLLVAADIYRPPPSISSRCWARSSACRSSTRPGCTPPELARLAYEKARAEKLDTVIIDTAGRLAIDDALMAELEAIKAERQARQHPPRHRRDDRPGRGEHRGRVQPAPGDRRLHPHQARRRRPRRRGAVDQGSHRQAHQVPGHGRGAGQARGVPARRASPSRILGFGDVVGLMKDFEGVVDQEKAEEDAKKLLSGRFNMKDFMEQIRTVRKMGPLKDLLEKMPFLGEMTRAAQPQREGARQDRRASTTP